MKLQKQKLQNISDGSMFLCFIKTFIYLDTASDMTFILSETADIVEEVTGRKVISDTVVSWLPNTLASTFFKKVQ